MLTIHQVLTYRPRILTAHSCHRGSPQTALNPGTDEVSRVLV
ncbi:hypothetical protein HMPREF0290_2722 [Corynebacterium efficiens YS-314]|nr:hypothetical protein HMPREF0290_2722 [Corynebacterium efficiens YS-314]